MGAGPSSDTYYDAPMVGDITLEELKKHNKNAERILLSFGGVVLDGTLAPHNYGPEGAYSEYAGHDFTYALISMSTDEKDLDNFTVMEENDPKVADFKNWLDYYLAKYPIVGRLIEAKGMIPLSVAIPSREEQEKKRAAEAEKGAELPAVPLPADFKGERPCMKTKPGGAPQ